jgi:hypothetical protein
MFWFSICFTMRRFTGAKCSVPLPFESDTDTSTSNRSPSMFAPGPLALFCEIVSVTAIFAQSWPFCGSVPSSVNSIAMSSVPTIGSSQDVVRFQ